MYKAYKYRIYPTKDQQERIDQRIEKLIKFNI